MTPPIPGGFLFYTKFAVENKVHYLVFRVQTVLRKVFGNRRVTVLLLVISSSVGFLASDGDQNRQVIVSKEAMF